MGDDLKRIESTSSTSSSAGLSQSRGSDSSAAEEAQLTSNAGNQASIKQQQVLNEKKKDKGKCLFCREKKYRICSHVVKFVEENKRENKIELVLSKNLLLSELQTSDSVERRHSLYTLFDTTQASRDSNASRRSLARFLWSTVKNFNSQRKDQPQIVGLGYEKPDLFFSYLKEVCSVVEKIFLNEERIVRVNSSAFVLGDIHGNLDDLLSFEKILWKYFPVVTPTLVFLGNYVDFSKWGVECALYIFVLKILVPNKFFFCRGRYDSRNGQRNFEKECRTKYGNDFGPKVYELINDVFDKMPLAVLIDETVFCCNGGPPSNSYTFAEILQINNDLKKPDNNSLEIMWNEPTSQRKLEKLGDTDNEKIDPSLRFQKKRSGGNYYNEDAVKTFLSKNKAQLMIRGQEVSQRGYRFHCSRKLLSIVSCSNFAGEHNDAACVLVEREKMHVITLMTR